MEKCVDSGTPTHSLLSEISNISRSYRVTPLHTLHARGNVLKSPKGKITSRNPAAPQVNLQFPSSVFWPHNSFQWDTKASVVSINVGGEQVYCAASQNYVICASLLSVE